MIFQDSVATPLRLALKLSSASATEGARFSECISPISLQFALKMAYWGTAGETKQQIARFIAPNSDRLFMGLFSATSGKSSTDSLRSFSLANAAWVDKSVPVASAYQSDLTDKLSASIQTLPLQEDPVEAADRINAWVSENTNGKIQRLIDASLLGRNAQLVLTNAIHFMAKWATSFDPELTSDEPFHTPTGDTIVATMHATQTVGYAETSTIQAIAIPYADSTYKMLLLLPQEHDPTLAANFHWDADTILAITRLLEQQKVDMAIPKFTIESSHELTQPLQKLGLTLPFSSSADFSPITGSANDLAISNVLQNAIVEVNEQGTEAAAATAIIMVRYAGPVETNPQFVADRPFLFVIYKDNPENALFAGSFCPSKVDSTR